MIALFASAGAGAALAGAPVLEEIDPPGVQVGGTATWTIQGRVLERVERFVISGGGVEAGAIERVDAQRLRLMVHAAAEATPGFRTLRAVGPGGISNLRPFRLDILPQTHEAEPNDDPAAATPVGLPSAVSGVLLPQDLDWFAFAGEAGQGVVIEAEAQRLGAPIVPVVRLLGPSGNALAQSQPLHDGGDCRLSFVLPADGRYCVLLRDTLYRGGTRARYRLRIDTGPFATGLFPLGGRRGEAIVLAASGGNLNAPWHKTIRLPDEPGAIVAPGLFTEPLPGSGRSLIAPMWLEAGEGPELVAPANGGVPGAAALPTRVPFGTTVNGTIDRPGAVGRYVVAVPAGEALSLDVHAAVLGSWLDSVVSVSDARGNTLAENDDRVGAGLRFGRTDPAARARDRDSRLELAPRGAEDVVVAIADRYGDGGPEYAYRLWVGPPRADFTVTLVLRAPAAGSTPGLDASGALNLLPGTRVALPLRVAIEGRPGPILVSAEGLPRGVSAEALTVRLPAGSRGGGDAHAPVVVEAALSLDVDPAARPGAGTLRIAAVPRGTVTPALRRWATATVALAPMPPDDPRPPPTWVATEFPVMVLGRTEGE